WDLALANRAGNGAEFVAGASAAAAAASSSTGVAASLDPTSSSSGLLSPASPAAEQEQGGPDPAHAVMVLQGLCSLRSKSVLTDVTLLADGQRFDVHKVILVSCSDYFRSMFTSGMKECSQSEIELKGVTAKGLEKVLDIIYTSSTSIEGDDVFDILAAATHLQVMPVLEFCERNFLRNMTAANFTDFIVTARLYNMAGVLAQIDKFIAANLLSIADGPALSQLGLDQMLACLRSPHCRLREIDVFRAVQLWLDARDQQQQCMEQLLTEIRYNLIAPSDLVSKVQLAPAVMANARLHSLLLQPLCTPPDMWLRCYREQLVCVGGRDLQPTTPGLVEDCSALLLPKPSQGATAAVAAAESSLMSAGRSSSTIRRHTLASLPTPVSHAQCVVLNNFLYVLGGCVTQCAHAESAVNAVSRFDLRFNAWY
uniref:BTB domain-containing protein n=1 Tax=Macrostomum lignano TaxID=282301 RepID=A0A1I8GAZ6_9PLAT